MAAPACYHSTTRVRRRRDHVDMKVWKAVRLARYYKYSVQRLSKSLVYANRIWSFDFYHVIYNTGLQ